MGAFPSRELGTATSGEPHQDTELATTISFKLAEAWTLDRARRRDKDRRGANIGIAPHGAAGGNFAGREELSAQAVETRQTLLIVAGDRRDYILLGILYERAWCTRSRWIRHAAVGGRGRWRGGSRLLDVQRWKFLDHGG